MSTSPVAYEEVRKEKGQWDLDKEIFFEEIVPLIMEADGLDWTASASRLV